MTIHIETPVTILLKRIEFVPVGQGYSPEWLGTVGKVINVDCLSKNITILIERTIVYKDRIGTETEFRIGSSWGYIILQDDWDE